MDDPRKPENAVLTLTLYKTDPFSVAYAFGIDSEADYDDPQHLEQVNICMGILKRHRRETEHGVMSKVIKISRDVRKQMKAEFEEKQNEVLPEPPSTTEH